MSQKLVGSVALFCVLIVNETTAQDPFGMNEDELFADTSVMVDSSKVVKSSEVEKTSVGFSGQINSYAGLNVSRLFFGSPDKKEIKPLASSTGNLMLDVRLPLNIKGFGNAQVIWSPDSDKAFFQLQELFVDANIAKWAYFRVGKQVLQWGRCSIWNPTDLINIEKKSLERNFGTREGSYGVKMHVPFGTKWNIYGFIDLNNVKASDSVAGTMKVESLIGNTEIGLGVWGKPAYDPVFGIDLSTSILDFSVAGELCLTSGKNYSILDTNTIRQAGLSLPLPMKKIDEDVVARFCIGISRFYDLLNVDDRLMVNLEYYYNQAGYEDNMFKQYVDRINDAFMATPPNASVSFSNELNKLYEPNSHSKHYMGLSSSVSKFIISEMTLGINGVINLNQGSGKLIANVHYQNMYNFFLGAECSAYLGEKNTEYTFLGNGASLIVYTGFSF